MVLYINTNTFYIVLLYRYIDTLKKLVEKCEVNAKVQDLCDFGDKHIAEETSKVFKKEKDLKKGIF